METNLDTSLYAADSHAQYDAVCKRVLSEKIILAWIMKRCLKEYADCTVTEIAEKYIEGTPQVNEIPVMPDKTNLVTGMNTEDSTITEGSINYDIRFRALAPTSNEMISLIINVEAQGDFSPGYPLLKRAIYYCSRMISAQKGTEFVHSHYEKIKKVYSIWVCLSPPEQRENSITRYAITEENLFGQFKEDIKNYDLLSVVNVCLGDPDIEGNDKLLRLLNVLFSPELPVRQKKQTLGNEFNIAMSSKLEGEVSAMGSLSQGVFNRGLKQGMEQGLERGIVKGRMEGQLEDIRNLMETLGLSAEQAMTALRIPETDRKKYLNFLEQ